MHFGMFTKFGPRKGDPEADAFREGLDLVGKSEAWAWIALSSPNSTAPLIAPFSPRQSRRVSMITRRRTCCSENMMDSEPHDQPAPDV